ncbi:MAG: choice-of-anchor B family protein [Flavobacteriales bacterium]|nr:choice-of-anchor B family protein [Flavobacteriales bacterium]MCB9448063.1 choice-of-anchor B family protein [Flavobacteriales bacterium]
MRNLWTLLCVCACSLTAFAQQSKNMNLLGSLTYSQSLSDIWGYVDTAGNEYALVGCRSGVSIVDVTDPTKPTEVFYTAGSASTWRDLKTWNKHAYITNETGNGLMIIDLSGLPSATPSPKVINDTTYFKKAHNLYIDENGICYVFGANTHNGGAVILDLNNDPEKPQYLGAFEDYYLHDGMVRGDTLWGSAIYDGNFAVIDVSDKSKPKALATQQTPGAFAHNAWISDDNKYLFTTDEISNAFIGSFDVSDLGNIKLLDKIQSNPGSNAVVHNTHYINGYLVTSYYRDGTTIHDVSRPNNIVQVGYYDSEPLSGNGYDGAWGAYPWLPSGNIIESNIGEGLFVYGPTYKRGCYLEGNVKDSLTLAPIPNVSVDIVSSGIVKNSNISGDYATGTIDAGTYDVTFSEPSYLPRTVKGVVLTNGVVTNLNVKLIKQHQFEFTGMVVEEGSGNPVPGANVKVVNQDFDFNPVTDSAGTFTISNMTNGAYDFIAGKWGYVNDCMTVSVDSINNTVTLTLPVGYYDDFTFDNGWAVTGDASTGAWVIGEPVGTVNGSTPASPDEDVSTDCYNQAYVTGNGGGSAGTDDVDNGSTILTSPVFDPGSGNSPYISLYYWFYNGGGSGAPNDTLKIQLTNGSVTKNIDVITPDSIQSQWVKRYYRMKDYMTMTSNMKLIVTCSDLVSGGGHYVEGGIDEFRVIDSVDVSTGTDLQAHGGELVLYPNPSQGEFSIRYNYGSLKGKKEVRLNDITGRTLLARELEGTSGNVPVASGLANGVYMVTLMLDGIPLETGKIMVLTPGIR